MEKRKLIDENNDNNKKPKIVDFKQLLSSYNKNFVNNTNIEDNIQKESFTIAATINDQVKKDPIVYVPLKKKWDDEYEKLLILHSQIDIFSISNIKELDDKILNKIFENVEDFCIRAKLILQIFKDLLSEIKESHNTEELEINDLINDDEYNYNDEDNNNNDNIITGTISNHEKQMIHWSNKQKTLNYIIGNYLTQKMILIRLLTGLNRWLNFNREIVKNNENEMIESMMNELIQHQNKENEFTN